MSIQELLDEWMRLRGTGGAVGARARLTAAIRQRSVEELKQEIGGIQDRKRLRQLLGVGLPLALQRQVLNQLES